jgi:hypothetical protein
MEEIMLKLKSIALLLCLIPMSMLEAKDLIASRLEDFYRDLESHKISLRYQVKDLLGDTSTEHGRARVQRFLSNTALNLRDMPMSYQARSVVSQHLAQIGQAISDTKRFVVKPKATIVQNDGEFVENITLGTTRETAIVKPEAKPVITAQPVAPLAPPVVEPKVELTFEDSADKVQNIAAAPSKASSINYSFWSQVIGWAAAVLFAMGVVFYAISSVMKRSRTSKKDNKKTQVQTKRFNYFNDHLVMLQDAPTAFVVISDKNEVCWSNRAAQTHFKWRMGTKITATIRNLENIGDDTYEMIAHGRPWVVQMKEIQMKSPRPFRLLTIVNAQPVQAVGKSYHIEENFTAQGAQMRTLLEEALERKAYLFQIAGITLNFVDFPSSCLAPAKATTSVLENTLHAVYLMLKDHPGVKDVTIRGMSRGERVGLSFQMKNFTIDKDILKQTNIYPGKRVDNAATVFRRNEMILANARGRVLLSHHKGEQGSTNSEIEIWMDRVRAAKTQQNTNSNDELPALPN